QERELVDVEVEPPPRDRDDQAEADHDLRGRDRHHRERKDLTVTVAVVARERNQSKVRPVQHDLEREQYDQRAAPEQHAERARREEDRRDGEVPGDIGTLHWVCSSRECSPRMTPPTAAISSTTEVISNASR